MSCSTLFAYVFRHYSGILGCYQNSKWSLLVFYSPITNGNLCPYRQCLLNLARGGKATVQMRAHVPLLYSDQQDCSL